LLETDLVTSSSIRGLLREFKPETKKGSAKTGRKKGSGKKRGKPQRLRISGKTKSAIIGHLRSAVGARLIPIERAYDLLREGEENGAQRIFFFLPRTKAIASACGNGAKVCDGLHGSSDASALGFPKLLEGWADDPVAADFRYADRRWTAKWYWRQIRHVTLEQDVPDGEDENGVEILKKRYKKIEERAVMVARWNSHSLELRVPNAAARNSVTQMVNRLWILLSPALRRADFEDWNLEPASTKMIKEAGKHAEIYDFGDTILRDSGGGTTVFNTKPPEPKQDEGGQLHIPFAPEQKQAVDIILKEKDNQSERLVVQWKKATATENGQPKNKPYPLRVVVAAEDKNEVSIGAKTTAKAIDYVIYRLRDFSPKVP
jgi:hypothetical protein